MPALVKILFSATLIWLVNEVVVKHSKPLVGSMIAALPLVSLITLIWIHMDLRDRPAEATARLSAYSIGLFWFVLPTLPLFLAFPALLKRGIGFWPSMAIVCVGTSLLYALTAKLVLR